MPRVQFVETVTLPLGPGGSLIPVPGIGTIPYTIDEATGNEGSQAPSYTGRTGNTQVSSLATDSTGTISYWLEAGDYNIHFQDQQSPPRIQAYVRGFNAALIDTSQIIVGAQNLIQFTGDYKFSGQITDHGLRPDGSYEWLLIFSEVSGLGRLVDHILYQGLWQQRGSPTPDSQGRFPLPNLSGRALVAAGQAAGLSNRQLYQMFGAETYALALSETPYHNHPVTVNNRGTGVTLSDPSHNHGIGGNVPTNWQGWGPLRVDGDHSDNNVGAIAYIVPYANNYAYPPDMPGVPNYKGDVSGASTGVSLSDPQHAHDASSGNVGGNPGNANATNAHNNVQPSCGMNLFIKT